MVLDSLRPVPVVGGAGSGFACRMLSPNLREALELYFEDAPADVVAKVEGPEVRRLTLERA
jgi:hypothetical protein